MIIYALIFIYISLYLIKEGKFLILKLKQKQTVFKVNIKSFITLSHLISFII
jgi:hypothetical protein